MKNQNIFNFRIKRIILFAIRGFLRFVHSWEIDPWIVCVLFAIIFGSFGALATFLVFKKINYTIVAGILSLIGNGLVMSSTCLGKKKIIEIHNEINATDAEIKIILYQRKITLEEKQKHLKNQRSEEENSNLKQNKIFITERNQKEELSRTNNEVKEAQKNHSTSENLTPFKTKDLNTNSKFKICWYCNQRTFPGWIQCVYCRVIV